MTFGRWDREADGARGFGWSAGAHSEEAGCHNGLTSSNTPRVGVDPEESEYGGGGGVGWHEKSRWRVAVPGRTSNANVSVAL